MATPIADSSSVAAFDGIYETPEVARYLRAARHGELVYSVRSDKLIRWIRRGVTTPALRDVPGRDLLLDFGDLVSLRVVLALRAAGVGWRQIDAAEQWLRQSTGTQQPFATETLWTGHGEVFADFQQRLISTSTGGQVAFDMLCNYLIPVHGLQFDEQSHTARSWEPVPGVLLEPTVQFGSPCLIGTRIPTRTVAGMVEAGDSVEWVAAAYGVPPEDVQAVCDWELSLRSR